MKLSHDKSLELDYNRCHQVMLKASKTFSLAFDQLPSPKKEAIWGLYAFNRRLDDLGDDLKDVQALEEEKKAFYNMLNEGKNKDYIYRVLWDVHQKFPLDVQAINAMFRGQLKDAQNHVIYNEQDLLTYCYEVAGSVGEMLLPILASDRYDQDKETLKESARNIGIGMQLTNILRDIKADYLEGRLYLPQKELEDHQINVGHLIDIQGKKMILFERNMLSEYHSLWEKLAQLADHYYQLGLDQIDLYDKECQQMIKGATYMYRAIIDEARKENYSLKRRAVVSPLKKASIIKTIYSEDEVI